MTGRKETKTTVVIIGAGAAGIGAGEELKNNSIDFLIIEAQGNIGGRMQKHNVCLINSLTLQKNGLHDYTSIFLK